MKTKKSSKVICALLAVAMCIGVVSGCGDKSAKKTQGEAKLTPNGTFPIVEEPITLSVMTGASTYVEDYKTNEYTKYYEEKTNVKIDWQIVSGDLAQKLNVTVASGNYPDVFLACTIKKPAQAQYGRDGILTPLNDLIENNTKWIKEVLEKEPYIKSQLVTPDGNIYGLPRYGYASHAYSSSKMWVYEPWLKKAGLKAEDIVTTEDFKNFLLKVRDGDYNGNGKKDEIPFLAIGTRDAIKYLMNAFVYMDDYEDFDFFVEDGKVKYTPTQEGFKEGLKYIQDLYNEGLIVKDSFVMDRQQRTSTVENPDYPLVACCPALWYGQFTVNNGGTGRYAEFTTIAPLEGPSGRRKLAQRNPLVDGQNFSISTSCAYPEVAIRWVDWFFSLDGQIEAENGEKDKYWREAKEGELNIYGKQAYWTSLTKGEFGETQNIHWVQLVPAYRSDDDEFINTSIPENNQINIRLNKESAKYKPFLEDKTIPDMFYDDDIMTEYSTLKASMADATYQAVADMIINNKDIDKEWDNYIANLNAQGLERYIEIQQQTYDKNFK